MTLLIALLLLHSTGHLDFGSFVGVMLLWYAHLSYHNPNR